MILKEGGCNGLIAPTKEHSNSRTLLTRSNPSKQSTKITGKYSIKPSPCQGAWHKVKYPNKETLYEKI